MFVLSPKPLKKLTGTDRRWLLYDNRLPEVVVIGGQDYVLSQADAPTKKLITKIWDSLDLDNTPPHLVKNLN